MVKTYELPADSLTGLSETGSYRFGKPIVLENTFEDIDKIQLLHVGPKTAINLHGHEGDQWEVLVNIANKTAYVCLKGQKHELVNNSDKIVIIIAIIGHSYCPLAVEFETFFQALGFSVTIGSLIIDD